MTLQNRSSSGSSLDSGLKRFDIPPEREKEIARLRRKWKEERKREYYYNKKRESIIAAWNKTKGRNVNMEKKNDEQRRRNRPSHGDRRRGDSSVAGPSTEPEPVPRLSRSPERNTRARQIRETQVSDVTKVVEKLVEYHRERDIPKETKPLLDIIDIFLKAQLNLPQQNDRDVQRGRRHDDSPHERDPLGSKSGHSRPLRFEVSDRRSHHRSRSRERSPRRVSHDRHRHRSRSRSRPRHPESRASGSRQTREEGSRRSPERRSSSRDYRQSQRTRRSSSRQERDYGARYDERRTAAGPSPSTSTDHSGSAVPPRQRSPYRYRPETWHPSPDENRPDSFPRSGPFPQTYPPMQNPLIPPIYYGPHGGYVVPGYGPGEYAERRHMQRPVFPPPSSFPPSWPRPRPPPFWINSRPSRPYPRNRFRVFRPNTTQATQQQPPIASRPNNGSDRSSQQQREGRNDTAKPEGTGNQPSDATPSIKSDRSTQQKSGGRSDTAKSDGGTDKK